MQRLCTLLVTTSALLPLGLAIAVANPQGPQVVGGSATVQGQGTPTVTVTQQSNSAIINWNTFNIGTSERTNIIMPSSSSVQLDRVTGGQGPSQILGTLWSNGRVFLVNPDGILFGAGAKVDTAGLLATTHDIANADFMAGRYNFLISGNPNASIVNLGTLTAQSGGFAALVAPGVRNSGTITATLGKVSLASGSGFTLDFYGDRLITLGVGNSIAANVKDVATGQPLSSLVSNDGKLSANGGRVELTAAAARQVVNSVINNKGVIEANSIGSRNGMIVLSAATASSKSAGSPTQTVNVSGTLSAAGTTPGTTGGTIQVTGENIAVTGAAIDASGAAGGGKVLIGGDAGGGNQNPAAASIPQAQLEPYAVPTASTVTVDAATTINASATGAGDGGKVVVWSDGATSFNGTILATGGVLGGNGGFVETSGHVLDFTGGRVDTSAPNGRTGSWLLDPVNLTADAPTISTNLATTNVTLQTTVSGSSGPGTSVAGSGDIIVNSGISWASANTLTLDAYHSVAINAGITVSGTGHLVLLTNDGGSGGGLTFGPGGSASFTGTPNTGQSLTINGNAYTLRYSMTDVQNINSTLGGRFALAKSLATGFANWAPIGSNLGLDFTGTFEGLGNTISNLTIAPTASNIDKIGLFGIIQAGGLVENLRLTNFNIQANPNLGSGPGVGFQSIGVLAGYNAGTVQNVTASGTINGGSLSGVAAGGLVGQNGFFIYPTVFGGTIQRSSAAVNVTLGDGVGCSGNLCNNSRTNLAGGLVGNNPGTIGNSSASGDINVGSNSQAGGLVGVNQTPPGVTGGNLTPKIILSFATGNVSSSGVNVELGGLVGYNAASVASGAGIFASYATGSVTDNTPLTANAGVDCSTSNCEHQSLGGLVGQNSGKIDSFFPNPSIPGFPSSPTIPTAGLTSCVGTGWSCASGAVHAGAGGQAGGLVGYNDGIIQYAYATTGAVTGAAGLSGLGNNGDSTTLGGLAATNQGLIQFSYATGNVGTLNVANLQLGGLAAENAGTIKNSYATGNVSAGNTSQAGGLTGNNGGWNNGCNGCNLSDGNAYFNTGLIVSSHATGNVTVGAGSLAGGLSGGGSRGNGASTFRNSFATGSVSGADNSILGGLVGFVDIGAVITNSTASGAVSSSGPNSWVGGLVGVNGGTISYVNSLPGPQPHASGPVTGTSDSILGGFAGLNFGVIADSTTSSTVSGPGPNNYVGGFVGVNFGWIDPSTATGNVTGGANSVVGGFAGANASVTGYSAGLIPGSTFPTGTISTDSSSTGLVNGAAGPQNGTSNPTSLPAGPAIVAGCHIGFCSILNGLTLASASTDLLPPPPPDKWINLPDYGVKTPDPILANLTPPSGPAASSPAGTGSYANATPGKPTFTPPPLPPRSVPGPNGETLSSMPPLGENRYFQNQVLLQLGLNISDAEIARITQELGLRIISSDILSNLGRKVIRLELPPGMSVRDAILRLEANQLVSVAAPHYQFNLTQVAPTIKTSLTQYLLNKLNLGRAHTIATGKGITIALIDSEIDKRHTELQGSISEELDTVGVAERLVSHGTEMAGAMVSHDRLLGVAPGAKILAVRAFGESNNTLQGTTLSILKGIAWAESKGARIINMSFAGPRDPSLERALKAAHDKGIVLIAAAGNAGPKSPPLYPGADPHVIAVTATDDRDQRFLGANQGPQLSLAAPGVNILAAAPDERYLMSTGTSIATAHVSGVVALMLERDPTLKPDDVRKILESTATDLGSKGKNGQFGWGLVNPPKALEAVSAQLKASDASSKNR